MIRFTQEHRDIREMVASFAANELAPRAAEIDGEPRFPAAALAELGELGLLGAAVPDRYGGSSGDALMTAVILEEMGAACVATALVAAAHAQSVVAITEHGSEAMREHFLPALAAGKLLATSAVTEAGQRGGERELSATAVRQGADWILNGRKTRVVSAAHAGLFVVAARVGSSASTRGTGLFVVEGGAGSSGVDIASTGSTLGARGAALGDVIFSDCRIPQTAMIGAGESDERPFDLLVAHARNAIGAIAAGLARSAYRYAADYATKRHAFGGPIARFPALRDQLADAATQADAAALLVYRAAARAADGGAAASECAMAKMFACDAAYRATKSAVQVLGGNGYSREYPVERMYRDAMTLNVLESPAEAHRALIAAGLFGE